MEIEQNKEYIFKSYSTIIEKGLVVDKTVNSIKIKFENGEEKRYELSFFKREYEILEEIKTKTYNIPIVWQSYKRISVQAQNLEEAVKTALKQFLSEPDDLYIDDSFEIDETLGEDYPDEHFNLDKIIQEL